MSNSDGDGKDLADAKEKLESKVEHSNKSDADEESLNTTKSELESLIERPDEDRTQTADDVGTGESDISPADLLDRVKTTLSSIIELLSSQATLEEVNEEITNLHTVADETRELLTTVEFTDLPDAVDFSDLDEVVEVDDIPEALADGDVSEAIQYSELMAVIEFDELLDAVDLREFRQNKDELTDTIDEFTTEETDDELAMLDMLEWITEALGIEDEGDGGILEAMDTKEIAETAIEDEAKQAAIQSQLNAAVEEFRKSVLNAREQMKEGREEASERVTEKTGGLGQPTSRNPTAFSTLISSWKHTGDGTRYSTVPPSTRYSTAAGHQRLYGSRFENRGDNDE